MKKYVYKTAPEVCSQQIVMELEGDVILHVNFVGGCPGSLQAVSRLVEGQTIDQAISRIQGIRCGGKATSCPDQLAIALTKIKQKLAAADANA